MVVPDYLQGVLVGLVVGLVLGLVLGVLAVEVLALFPVNPVLLVLKQLQIK
jgi:uncharacterized membrane protein